MGLPVQEATVPAGDHVRWALRQSECVEQPFRHWRLSDVLPDGIAAAVVALPFQPADIGNTLGRRETHNSSRIFASAENRRAHPACQEVAAVFQDSPTVRLIETLCGIRLSYSFLRIECCLDTDGFWLEPHTDIDAKLLTLLIYLSDHPDAENWGTDIMDADGNVLGRASGAFNRGLMFVPASNSWHGFTPRPIAGVRRSLIVNYVKPLWRSRHELAYPETPVIGQSA